MYSYFNCFTVPKGVKHNKVNSTNRKVTLYMNFYRRINNKQLLQVTVTKELFEPYFTNAPMQLSLAMGAADTFFDTIVNYGLGSKVSMIPSSNNLGTMMPHNGAILL